MWRRFESGHEVDLDQFWLQDRDMNRVNDAVLHDLPEDEALAERAVKKSEKSLGVAA